MRRTRRSASSDTPMEPMQEQHHDDMPSVEHDEG